MIAFEMISLLHHGGGKASKGFAGWRHHRYQCLRLDMVDGHSNSATLFEA
jgi:Cu2+-containing amine oxidase